MNELIEQTLLGTLDRFKKLRIGQLQSDIDDNGEIAVKWLDGEPGGQSNIIISYTGFNNSTDTPYGEEIGHGKGTVGVFGFVTDNHAVLLTTLISKVKGKNVGYDKTDKIKSGEWRVTSIKGSKIFLDKDGNIRISQPNNKILITITNDGKLDITTTSEINFTCKKMTIKTDTTTTTF